MNENIFRVRLKSTGLEYMLCHKGGDRYYICPVEGYNGQTVHYSEKEIEELFDILK
jgi:hypothetical protein